MKNKKLTLIASIILVIAMLFGTMTVAATDGTLETAPTTEVTTTAPADETTTEPTTQAPTEETTEPTTEAPTDETTTTADSYYDDSEYESEEEKEAYDEGYWDGYSDGWDDAKNEYEGEDYDSGYDDGWDDGYGWGESDGYYEGYEDGYYEGYYEAMNSGQNNVITIFDRWDAFIEDLRERVEYFLYEIRDFFERIFKTGDYAPQVPVDPDNSGFIPEGFEGTLKDDEEAQAVCDEFNDLVNNFVYAGVPANVNITKTVDVDVKANDLPSAVQAIVQPVIEKFLVSESSTQFFFKGDSAYHVQETRLIPDYLTVAEKTVNEDGTTDYRFEVIEEVAYYDGYETNGVRKIDGTIYSYTLQHEYIADALYVEYGYLDPVTITSAKITYPGATVTAKTDAQGRLIKYDIDMPVKGEATGKAGFITATVALSGYRNEGFVMDYDV